MADRSKSPAYTEIKETDDVYRILKNAYPQNRNPYDHEPPQRAPHRMSRTPEMDEYRASHASVKNTPVSKPLDESGPTFRDSKAAHLNDTANTWVRGFTQRPAFDSGPSGFRYDTKVRR